MSSASPTWDAVNLTRHHQRRLRQDPECFEDLLGITKRVMTESEYENRSHDTVTQAWGEYEGEEWDEFEKAFRETRVYYVDDDLVIAITDGFRRRFITCYHEHPRRTHTPRANMPSVGRRRLEYRQRLANAKVTKLIRNVRRIRGV